MLNQIALLINVIGVVLLEVLTGGPLTITQNVPAAMAPGSEVKVTVNVDKGDLTGFAKLQIDLPDGLTATAIETKGASFTFADGKAKFIWMSLPQSPTFKVTYTLSAATSTSGVQRIAGRFSYIENNERKVQELSPSTVDLGAPGAVVATSTETVTEDPQANDIVSAAGAAPVGTVTIAVIENASGVTPMQGAGGVGGKRTITPVTEKEMLVEVVVNKGAIRGFGKLQEVIPAGFTAIEKNSAEAIFTTQDRIVKFVWLNLPASNEVKVVYKLRANEKPDGEYSIDGDFGYLLNDETQKAVLGTSKFYIGSRAFELMAADPNSLNQQENQDPSLALRLKEEEERKAREVADRKAREAAAREALAQQQKAAAQEKAVVAERPSQRVPAPEKGVTYKVQITAAHREVGKAYFKARHQYAGDFQIERHQGWIKYVTGSYSEYKAARDTRVGYVQAGHNFPGPFVTAYNNGERITVQEALAISKQQWVQ